MKENLQRLGIQPSRKLGQNFLVDKNWIQKTVSCSGILPKDRIIEIGPGFGALTRELLAHGAEVWAVELDRRIASEIKNQLLPLYPDAFHLVQGDAVEVPKAAAPSYDNYKVLANLPYSITSPWLDQLLQDPDPLPQELHLILQKDAADRLIAAHKTKDYGPMSIRLQLCYDFQGSENIPYRAFYPEPQVSSCLVHWTRKTNPWQLHPPTLSFLKETFQHRRKQIKKAVQKQLPEDIAVQWIIELANLGLTPTARPEEIPLAGWVSLDKIILTTEKFSENAYGASPQSGSSSSPSHLGNRFS